MAENVFILGAGASVHAGAPLMENFLDKAEDLLLSNSVHKDIKSIFEFLAKIQNIYSKANIDLNNIEAIFGILEMALIFEQLYTYTREKIQNLRKGLIQLITRTLEESIIFNYTDTGGNRFKIRTTRDYDILARFVKNNESRNCIITFNYDIALDYALSYHQINYDYCLDKKTKSLKYIKLHGSINWFRKKRTKNILSFDIQKLINNFCARLTPNEKVKLIFSDKIAFLAEQYQVLEKDIDSVPFIVPPTWNKSNYNSDLSAVWKQAARELSKAKNIYIIGYSLPESDSFFKYLYALGTLSDTRLRRLWVFNPDVSEQIKQRYKSMIGNGIQKRFMYFPVTFTKALEKIKKSI